MTIMHDYHIGRTTEESLENSDSPAKKNYATYHQNQQLTVQIPTALLRKAPSCQDFNDLKKT